MKTLRSLLAGLVIGATVAVFLATPPPAQAQNINVLAGLNGGTNNIPVTLSNIVYTRSDVFIEAGKASTVGVGISAAVQGSGIQGLGFAFDSTADGVNYKTNDWLFTTGPLTDTRPFVWNTNRSSVGILRWRLNSVTNYNTTNAVTNLGVRGLVKPGL